MIRGLQFGSLNHAPGGIINPPGPVMTDANTLILLRLSGAQPTWRDLLLTSSRSKMLRICGDVSSLRFSAERRAAWPLVARAQQPGDTGDRGAQQDCW
jgi:hypothetical protein